MCRQPIRTRPPGASRRCQPAGRSRNFAGGSGSIEGTDTGRTDTGATGDILAVCGDGVVEGGEVCDDGDADECGNDCLPPTCFDGKQNNGEEKVDCGGTCSTCTFVLMFGGNAEKSVGASFDGDTWMASDIPAPTVEGVALATNYQNAGILTELEADNHPLFQRYLMKESLVAILDAATPDDIHNLLMDSLRYPYWPDQRPCRGNQPKDSCRHIQSLRLQERREPHGHDHVALWWIAHTMASRFATVSHKHARRAGHLWPPCISDSGLQS